MLSEEGGRAGDGASRLDPRQERLQAREMLSPVGKSPIWSDGPRRSELLLGEQTSE